MMRYTLVVMLVAGAIISTILGKADVAATFIFWAIILSLILDKDD